MNNQAYCCCDDPIYCDDTTYEHIFEWSTIANIDEDLLIGFLFRPEFQCKSYPLICTVMFLCIHQFCHVGHLFWEKNSFIEVVRQ